MTFVVRNAKPNTLYTVWLRLSGVDSEGNPYGGNPLTGLPVTPLTASSELPDQLAATLPHPGSSELANGFRTNHRGNGRLKLSVDFPITSGAYPFQRFPNFDQHKDNMALTNDANVARLGDQAASIRPIAIPDGSQAPATILIASHCVDGVAHGLIPGPHETGSCGASNSRQLVTWLFSTATPRTGATHEPTNHHTRHTGKQQLPAPRYLLHSRDYAGDLAPS